MKKKIRLLAVCAIMLCGMIVGGIAKPAEVMAKQTIKATREMKDAPKIQLDKLYHIWIMELQLRYRPYMVRLFSTIQLLP